MSGTKFLSVPFGCQVLSRLNSQLAHTTGCDRNPLSYGYVKPPTRQEIRNVQRECLKLLVNNIHTCVFFRKNIKSLYAYTYKDYTIFKHISVERAALFFLSSQLKNSIKKNPYNSLLYI